MQELLRHATVKMTLEVYAQAVTDHFKALSAFITKTKDAKNL